MANTKPRRDSRALVAGVTLFEKTIQLDKQGNPEYSHRVVRGSAQIDDEQKMITRSVAAHGLKAALRQVCAWRYARAQPPGYQSAEELYADALEAVPDELREDEAEANR